VSRWGTGPASHTCSVHSTRLDDGPAGIDAGRAGHLGYVVGVDRLGRAAELRRQGADVVVSDLAVLLAPGQPEIGAGAEGV